MNISPFAAWAGGGAYTLISAPGGGIDATKFTLGNLPVALFTSPPTLTSPGGTSLVLNLSMADIPTTAYWHGGLSSVWNANSGTSTNWSDQTGTQDTHQFPGGSSQVIFSAALTGNRTTTLGANIGILGLELADPNTVSIGGANILSIGANGISVDAGAAADTISTSAVALNGNQTWTNNSQQHLLRQRPHQRAVQLDDDTQCRWRGNFPARRQQRLHRRHDDQHRGSHQARQRPPRHGQPACSP